MQLADGLLKLHVPGAGFIADISMTSYLALIETRVSDECRTPASHREHSQARTQESACACFHLLDGAESYQELPQRSIIISRYSRFESA